MALSCVGLSVSGAGAQPAEPAGEQGEAPDGEGTSGEGGEQEAAAAPAGPPKWQWKQVLSSPRIGGRLRAVQVDPQNPRRVYVGTEEGTLLRSRDGGLTWREIEIRPFVFQDRAVRPRAPGLPRLGKKTRLGFTFFLDPPFRASPPDRVTLRFQTLFFDIKPEFMSLGFTPRATPLKRSFLFDVVRSQRRLTVPVRNIAVCPGAKFPLIIATSREVLGSIDEGLTWVRLFRLPGRIGVNWVQCSEYDPNHIMVGSGFGLFVSRDGGATFDQDLSGWPGRSANAVAFGPPQEDGSQPLYVATGHTLFAGDPQSDQGLRMIYPDFNNSSTAPWKPIWWIEVTDNGDIWLATSDGVRVSKDGGESWDAVARSLLSREQAWQVMSGANEQGGERIAALLRDCPVKPRRGQMLKCRGSYVYATDDGGQTWFPFFHGITRRGVRQMATAPAAPGVPPRWWIVTGGELWATVAPQTQDVPVPDRQAALWARRKLSVTPPLRAVLDAVQDNTDLSPQREEEMVERIERRNWMPIINAELNVGNVQDIERAGDDIERMDVSRREVTREPTTGALLQDRRERVDNLTYFFFIQATWVLRDTQFVLEDAGPTRRALHELRRQVMFIAEDAWHERVNLLQNIARGMTDPLEIAILKERIAALETVLDNWMGRSLEAVEARRSE